MLPLQEHLSSIWDSMAVRKDRDPRVGPRGPLHWVPCVVGPRLTTLPALVCLLIGQMKGLEPQNPPCPSVLWFSFNCGIWSSCVIVFLPLPALWMTEVCEDFMCFMAQMNGSTWCRLWVSGSNLQSNNTQFYPSLNLLHFPPLSMTS